AARAGLPWSEPSREAQGLEERPRLRLGLALLGRRIGVGHDPAPGLDDRVALVEDDRADGDAEVEVAPEVHVAERAPVNTPADGLELVDDLHGPDLRRPRERARGEGGGERVER